MRRVATLCTAALLLACGDDGAAAPPGGTSTGAPTTDASTSGPMASTGGPEGTSTSTGSTPEPQVVFEDELELELGELAQVEFVLLDGELTATVTLANGYGIAPSGEPLQGPGRVDAYPEAGATLYTATFATDPIPDGPCAEQPIALALSLHVDADSPFATGGMTGYCGASAQGRPVVEPLRLSRGL